ncbi:hypothetical protein TPA0910_13200 [Streptomyces hygroscopicus subsp. sporocinereus]|uniref:Secreted protein n=1 Tax=Streptomyces hygroscopicus TaxID=1912 RepID=A0ABQ3TU92_STRHY|nr:hypothetical protein TPA0910_13200 [Streptomyces hygroscopicus]
MSVLGAVVVLVQLRRVRVAQRAQGAGGRDARGDAVAAEQVQVLMLERGEPGDVLVPEFVTLGPELGDGGVDVAGGPEGIRGARVKLCRLCR